MLGWIVRSRSGLYLALSAAQQFGRPNLTWAVLPQNALRFASKKQAESALRIYPGAEASVEHA